MFPFRTVLAAAWLACCAQVTTAGETPMPGMSMIAGHFHLTAPDGVSLDSADLAGKPYGLFFGFTTCPDLCPTTLSELSSALGRLPAAARDLRVYFVSVDPERDTPEVLKLYMAGFDPRIVALSGSRAAVDEAIGQFGVVARRTDLPNGGYAYGHTASVLLVDRDGLIVERAGVDAGPEVLAAKLAALAGAPPSPPEHPAR